MTLNAKLRGKYEMDYASVWCVATTLDPQIMKPEEVS